MVCFRNICINTLHKENDDDDDNNNNNNNNNNELLKTGEKKLYNTEINFAPTKITN
jgi:hypothetical protein